MSFLDICACGIKPFQLPTMKDSRMTQTTKPTNWVAIASLIAQCTIPVLLVSVGFVGGQVLANKDSITAMKAVQYTAEQAHKDQSELRNSMWTIQQSMPNMDRVTQMENRLSNLEVKIDKLRDDIRLQK